MPAKAAQAELREFAKKLGLNAGTEIFPKQTKLDEDGTGNWIIAPYFGDTFGGMLFDGPIGPIPGGALSGPGDPNPNPDWTALPEVIELEIRPEKPWSLSVWNAVVDGKLYVPSAFGARRRWPAVALEDPRVRFRAGGKIYERRIVRFSAQITLPRFESNVVLDRTTGMPTSAEIPRGEQTIHMQRVHVRGTF